VIGAGKSGQVIAFRAADGRRLWTLAIGRHNRSSTARCPPRPSSTARARSAACSPRWPKPAASFTSPGSTSAQGIRGAASGRRCRKSERGPERDHFGSDTGGHRGSFRRSDHIVDRGADAVEARCGYPNRRTPAASAARRRLLAQSSSRPREGGSR
jgi:hypothetical protein